MPKIMKTPKSHVAVRLDAATLVRVDALIPGQSTAAHEGTRSDVVRALVLTGLPVLERASAEGEASYSIEFYCFRINQWACERITKDADTLGGALALCERSSWLTHPRSFALIFADGLLRARVWREPGDRVMAQEFPGPGHTSPPREIPPPLPWHESAARAGLPPLEGEVTK